MRLLPEILCALAVTGAYGHDLTDALARRNAYSADAAEMRKVYRETAVKVDSPAEDVSVPIEMYPDGSVKSLIHAREAQYFLQDGIVWAKGVTLRQLDRAGREEAVVNAETCVVDRNRKRGWAEGAASADYETHHLEGDNVYFSLDDRYFRIADNARLTTRDFKIGRGMDSARKSDKPSGGVTNGPSARLTCRRADYDNKQGVILFDGDVVLDDGEYRLGSDRVWLFFEETNSISRLEAQGAVTVTNGTRSAACDMAEYEAGDRRLTMYSGDGAPAELVEDGKNRSRIRGDVISFWIDSEQVEVERPVVTIETTGGTEWKRTLSQKP